MSTHRELLLSLFEASVEAASPTHCLPPHLPKPPNGRTLVIGAGKAAASMARAVEDHWQGDLSGLVITRYGHGVPLDRIELVEAAHPVPDAAGREAARRILSMVQDLGPDDLLLCLISGGGSALLALPTGDSRQQHRRGSPGRGAGPCNHRAAGCQSRPARAGTLCSPVRRRDDGDGQGHRARRPERGVPAGPRGGPGWTPPHPRPGLDTDGIDGTEDNAGAILTPDTLARAEALGIKAKERLADNDGYGFFSALGDLIVTGPTRTNVNDMRIILIDP